MRKLSKQSLVFSSVFLLAALFAFSGCQQQPPAGQPAKPAEEIIKEGFTKLSDMKSYSYEMKMDMNVEGNAGKTNKLAMNLQGGVDMTAVADPKFSVKADVSFAGDDYGSQETGNIAAEMRLNKILYFNVSKFEVPSMAAVVPADITAMFNKWWKVTLPPEVLKEVSSSFPQGSQELTPEQAKFKKMFEDNKVFEKPVYVGMADVKGESSYHYSVTVNKEALGKFFEEIAKEGGNAMTADEVKAMGSDLKKVDISGDVWVGSTSGILNQTDLVIKLDGLSNEVDMAKGTVSLHFALGDVNKPIVVEEVKEAEEFPTENLFQYYLMMMGGGAQMTPADLQAAPADESTVLPQ